MTRPAGFTLASPFGRAVAVAIDPAADDANHPDERAIAAQQPPLRRGEWLAGRRALRAALAELGVPATEPIGADDRGAPRLPPGAVGSISHKIDLAIALAAAAGGQTVGIDLERRGPRRIDLSRRVLTPAEQAALAGLAPPARGDAVVRTFALKEAVYKAIDPFLRRYVGFQEVEVWPADDGLARVEPLADWGLAIEAHWVATETLWIATARARPR